MSKIDNTRIREFKKLISPKEIRASIPISESSIKTIARGREDFCNILSGEDKRFVVIVGPCSIHDERIAIEYAEKLQKLAEKFGDKLLIIMRVYFEKPRTTTGWKGLINDHFFEKNTDIEAGLKIARKILIKIADIGVPAATEFLDPIVSAHIGELVSWGAIGARTTESQTHREMVSGLSAPIGFKNNTDGNLITAINAMESAKAPHAFLGINDEGECCIVKTKGNGDTHIVLRGGGGRPNYHTEDVEKCEAELRSKNIVPRIMIDCSHENSGKDHKRQKIVVRDILEQKKAGNESVFGIMLESNLFEGSQKVPGDIKDLKYGVSITDACIGWEETEKLLGELHGARR